MNSIIYINAVLLFSKKVHAELWIGYIKSHLQHLKNIKDTNIHYSSEVNLLNVFTESYVKKICAYGYMRYE